MDSGKDAIQQTGEALAEVYQEPKSLEETIDYALEHPDYANFAPSDQYLLQAIESAGTREVIEEGEVKERYRFFDDPWNEGENAVLGNTDVLNEFVDDLRQHVDDRGDSDTMYWVKGPTASGKSEFKRCVIKGLREYSKTDEGRPYTIEWNIDALEEQSYPADEEFVGKMFNNPDQDMTTQDSTDWKQDPTQTNPMELLHADVKDEIYEAMNEDRDYEMKSRRGMSPFSESVYDMLFEKYRSELGYDEDIDVEQRADVFQKLVEDDVVQVKNFVLDVGNGIGVLNAEDSSNARQPKQTLVGSWTPQLLKKYDSEGRKNPIAFSYDGLLSKGNGYLTFIEDAFEHKDLVKKLHSVPDEKQIQLPEGPNMDIDTQIFIISNNDLEEHFKLEDDQYQETDPNESLLRRTDEYPLNYLTEYGLSAQLLKREATGAESVDLLEDPEERADKIREPVMDDGVEYAPHTMETASMYAVLTRLDDDLLPGPSEEWDKRNEDLPDGEHGDQTLNLLEKAQLYETGTIERDGEEFDKTDFAFPEVTAEGDDGIPITYLAGVVADLSQKDRDRGGPEGLDIDDVVMPYEALEELQERLSEKSMFDDAEVEQYRDEDLTETVEDFMYETMKDDVLDAMIGDKMPSDDRKERYLDAVLHNVGVLEDIDEHNPDLFMKDFETKFLGFDDSSYGQNASNPSQDVAYFREKEIKEEYATKTRKKDGSVSWEDIDALRTRLEGLEWSHIDNFDEFEHFDPSDWKDTDVLFDQEALENNATDTAQAKTKTLQRMVTEQDYTEASAFLTARHVMDEAFERGELPWD
ncbi:MAG: kinase anchor protein [Candidatus Nanohaloarchaeota archaeon QJJ-5]|nr:kinase anchor protein [Candidatus Nanohaloarchaeota archaeon QJJ-5]